MATILVVSINADGISYCGVETMKEAAERRANFFQRLVRRACEPVKFFPALRDKIINEKPNIVVIGTQQEDVSHSQLHSVFLPEKMDGLGYELLRSEMLKDVGIDSHLLGSDRMQPGTLGLMTSVYVSKYFTRLLTLSKKFGFHYDIDTRKCGALCHYVYTERHRLAFINVSMPDRADISQLKTTEDFSRYNEIIASENKSFLLRCLKEFALNEDPEYKPTSVILFGDMATSIKTSKTAIEVIARMQGNLASVIAADSFRDTKHFFDINLQEGEIKFPPTFRKRRDAPDRCETDWQKMPSRDCYASSDEYGDIPSYRDRILYTSLETPKIELNEYSSLYLPNNEHNGVMSTFTLL